ncbi:hypothetical protein Ga0080574_TMP965 [Salipiger abyssi]|uniref:Uncharacterized protein n=1 Tax=Salipiger abyssi TaxID=1250539 RepID=A0A1P8UPG9_9RHOB|nr:hypothetical protein Ga0080574_TMP965 [Salipiger abyssi]
MASFTPAPYSHPRRKCASARKRDSGAAVSRKTTILPQYWGMAPFVRIHAAKPECIFALIACPRN